MQLHHNPRQPLPLPRGCCPPFRWLDTAVDVCAPDGLRPCGLIASGDDLDGVVNESAPLDDGAREGLRGADAVTLLRGQLAEVCDLIPLTPDEDFHFTSRTR